MDTVREVKQPKEISMTKVSSVRPGLNFDGTGYVSGVGASKYWGVMVQNRKRGQEYHIAVREVGGEPRIFKADFELDEVTAASIASSFYETPIPQFGTDREVADADGRHVYRVTEDGRIRKYDTKVMSGARSKLVGIIDNWWNSSQASVV